MPPADEPLERVRAFADAADDEWRAAIMEVDLGTLGSSRSTAIARADLQALVAEHAALREEATEARAEAERLLSAGGAYVNDATLAGHFARVVTERNAARAALASMTIDRDSWEQQAEDRVDDAVEALKRAEKAEQERDLLSHAFLAEADDGSMELSEHTEAMRIARAHFSWQAYNEKRAAARARAQEGQHG